MRIDGYVISISMKSKNSENKEFEYFIYAEFTNRLTGEKSPLQYKRILNYEFSIVQDLNTEDYDYIFYATRVKANSILGQTYQVFYSYDSSCLSNPYIISCYETESSFVPEFEYEFKSAGINTEMYNLTYSIPKEQFDKFDYVEAYYYDCPTGNFNFINRRVLGTLTDCSSTFPISSYNIFQKYRGDVTGKFYGYSHEYSYIIKIGITGYIGNVKYEVEKTMCDIKLFEDNIKPSVSSDSFFATSSRDIYYYGLAPYDIDFGMKHNGNDKVDVRCYFLKVLNSDLSKLRWSDYTSEIIKTSYITCVDFEFEEKKIKFLI